MSGWADSDVREVESSVSFSDASDISVSDSDRTPPRPSTAWYLRELPANERSSTLSSLSPDSMSSLSAAGTLQRTYLEKLAASDTSDAGMAVGHLATAWPDNDTRQLLVEVARSGDWGAREAVKQLATHWPDESTHELLVAVTQWNSGAAWEAVRMLNSNNKWRDEEARRLLVQRVQSGQDRAVMEGTVIDIDRPDEDTHEQPPQVIKLRLRGADRAVKALATYWHNDDTRNLLVELARSARGEASEAIEQLVTYWHDEGTRKLLVELAYSQRYKDFQAVMALAKHWPDDDTCNILRSLAQMSNVSAVRAVEELAAHWPNDATRELLVKVAQSDKIGANNAVRLLAQHWPDEDTRAVLTKMVKVDSFSGSSEAMRQLAKHWPDKHTRKLLMDKARSGAYIAVDIVCHLAKHWRDDVTREQLMSVIQSSGFRRGIAVKYATLPLWRDIAVRKVLEQIGTAWPDQRTGEQLLRTSKVLLASI